MIADDPFADFDTEHPTSSPSAESGSSDAATGQDASGGFAGPASSGGGFGGNNSYGGGGFAQELHSEQVRGQLRTFFLDLKQSPKGKFVKVSEKSRGGQKTTIMFDVEDLDAIIAALQNIKARV